MSVNEKSVFDRSSLFSGYSFVGRDRANGGLKQGMGFPGGRGIGEANERGLSRKRLRRRVSGCCDTSQHPLTICQSSSEDLYDAQQQQQWPLRLNPSSTSVFANGKAALGTVSASLVFDDTNPTSSARHP